MASLKEVLERNRAGKKPTESTPPAPPSPPAGKSRRKPIPRNGTTEWVKSSPTVIVDGVISDAASEWIEAMEGTGSEPADNVASNVASAEEGGTATADAVTQDGAGGSDFDPEDCPVFGSDGGSDGGSDLDTDASNSPESDGGSNPSSAGNSSAGNSPQSSADKPQSLVSDVVRMCHECGHPINVGDVYHRKQVPTHPGSRFPVYVDAHPRCMGKQAGNSQSQEEQKPDAAKPPPSVDLSEIEAELSRIRAKLSTLEASGKALHSDLFKAVKSLNGKIEALKAVQRVEIVIKTPDRELLTLEDEFLHPAYAEVLDLVCDREEVFLPGPAGCGKTHMAQQVASAFAKFVGMSSPRFESLSCSGGVTESSFFGRLVPSENTPEKAISRFESLISAGMNEQAAASAMGADAGAFRYQSTPFLEMYERGGVFLLDEVDACDPNVLVAVNSALSNGWVNIAARPSNPRAVRHPDFVCIAAANTFGRGADRLYVGRTQLDESTLDRFRFGVVPMDYAEELERRLLPVDSLRQRLVGYRRKMIDAKLERVCSTRFMAKTHRAYLRFNASGRLYGHKTFEDYVDAKLFAGWSDKEIMTVRGSRLPQVKA